MDEDNYLYLEWNGYKPGRFYGKPFITEELENKFKELVNNQIQVTPHIQANLTPHEEK